jgi:hypothetical protein
MGALPWGWDTFFEPPFNIESKAKRGFNPSDPIRATGAPVRWNRPISGWAVAAEAYR